MKLYRCLKGLKTADSSELQKSSDIAALTRTGV